VILADTSIWIDFLRAQKPEMQKLLEGGQIVMHPFIVAEVALGSLQNRHQMFALMESLWMVRVAHLDEIRQMIEFHRLYSRGLGLTDLHLLASCLITPGIQLWTGDVSLEKAAMALGGHAILPLSSANPSSA
jgi:predicted nucleic acid-binding protein